MTVDVKRRAAAVAVAAAVGVGLVWWAMSEPGSKPSTTASPDSTAEPGRSVADTVNSNRPAAVLGSTTVPTEGVGADRASAQWFRNGLGQLVDDRGTVYLEAATADLGGPAVRLSNGDIYAVQDRSLFHLPAGSMASNRVALDAPVIDVRRGADDAVIWFDDTNTPRVLSGGPQRDVDAIPGPRRAMNGYTASIVNAVEPPVEAASGNGAAGPFLVVTDAAGETVSQLAIGGSLSTWVRLLDFDGRRVVVSRQPDEPAAGPAESLAIALDCEPACLQSWTGMGTTILNGPDVGGSPTILVAQGDLCPPHVFDADAAPLDMPDAARVAYRKVLAGVETCDRLATQSLADVAANHPAPPWEQLAEAMTSSPGTNGTEWTFEAADAPSVAVTIDSDGSVTVSERP